MDWQHVNFPSQEKIKMQTSVGKVMCAAFWDRKRVVLLDFLEPNPTINSDPYLVTLTKLKAGISRIRLEKTTFLLQHCSTRPPASLKTMKQVADLA